MHRELPGDCALRVPAAMAEVTADWVTQALSPNFPGAEVTRLDFGRVIHGTATKIRLLLEYNTAGHAQALPPTLWLKIGLESHSEQQAAVYRGETRFYADLARSLDIGCPRAFAAFIDPGSGRAALLLEDLLARNVRFTDATTPLALEEAARVIRLLARLHGRSWHRAGEGQADWLRAGGALQDSGIIETFFRDPVWSSSMSLPRASFARGRLDDRARLGSAMLTLLEGDRLRAHCIVHGDSHIGNLCLDQRGEPAYIDWQTVMLGHWAHDVGNFIPLALSTDDRRHGERDLIALYLSELGQYDAPAPSFDTAWLEYRAHAFYTFNFVLCPVELQAEEICVPSAERACAAIQELNSLDAIAELEASM